MAKPHVRATKRKYRKVSLRAFYRTEFVASRHLPDGVFTLFAGLSFWLRTFYRMVFASRNLPDGIYRSRLFRTEFDLTRAFYRTEFVRFAPSAGRIFASRILPDGEVSVSRILPDAVFASRMLPDGFVRFASSVGRNLGFASSAGRSVFACASCRTDSSLRA